MPASLTLNFIGEAAPKSQTRDLPLFGRGTCHRTKCDLLKIKKLLREKRLHDIVDRNLKQEYDPNEVEIIVRVALLCTQSSPEDRPKMADVVNMLKGEGLADRWAEWEQLEVIRNQEYSVMPQHFNWDEDSPMDQEAIQLSEAR